MLHYKVHEQFRVQAEYSNYSSIISLRDQEMTFSICRGVQELLQAEVPLEEAAVARTASSSGVPACFTTDLLAIVAPAARLSAKQPESCQQQLNNVQRHMTGLTRLSLNRDGQLENAHPNIHVAPSQVWA